MSAFVRSLVYRGLWWTVAYDVMIGRPSCTPSVAEEACHRLANLGACLRDAGMCAAAADKAPGGVVERTAERLCNQHGSGWSLIDGEQQSEWIGAIFDVLHWLKVDEYGAIHTMTEHGLAEELEVRTSVAEQAAKDRDDAMADADRVADRIITIADEAFGPFGVRSAEDAMTAIERGVFEQRQTAERYRAALESIATSPLISYDAHGPAVSRLDRQWQIGFSDGTRQAAEVARAALAGEGETL